MKRLDFAAVILILIGAFNWGLVGVFQFNLIDAVFESPVVSRLVYTLFAFAALYSVLNWRSVKARWVKDRY